MAYEIVFTAHDFVEGLKALPFTLKGSFYSNKFPQNCLYNQGNGVFSSDCWNLDKAFIWCEGNLPKNKGQYSYAPGKYGLGDWDGNKLMSVCSDVSTDFTRVDPGEGLLTASGDHWGNFVGEFVSPWDNKTVFNVIECTPIWNNGIQGSYVDAQGRRFKCKGGEQAGAWAKHGKLPWVDYSNGAVSEKTIELDAPKDATKIVINLK